MPDPTLDLILTTLDQAYDRKSWHGTNLAGSLRGVAPELAAWRPGPERHNVWEYALHAAYWKYAVRRRITGEPRGSFALEGSDFFPRPQEGRATEAAWTADRRLLAEEHRRLREAVAGLTVRELERGLRGSTTTFRDLILGAAAHDVYHAGQIQLIKRLARER